MAAGEIQVARNTTANAKSGNAAAIDRDDTGGRSTRLI
jgi:hypothetical protein